MLGFNKYVIAKTLSSFSNIALRPIFHFSFTYLQQPQSSIIISYFLVVRGFFQVLIIVEYIFSLWGNFLTPSLLSETTPMLTICVYFWDISTFEWEKREKLVTPVKLMFQVSLSFFLKAPFDWWFMQFQNWYLNYTRKCNVCKIVV